MRALIQRVRRASVEVDGQCVGSIGAGLLLFLGIERGDDHGSVAKMCDKVFAYRVFSDSQGKMNLGLKDTSGELLVVSQFTLVASTQKGLRPSFSSAAPPELAQNLYNHFVDQAKNNADGVRVAQGVFAADMQVSLVNDGPVTFLLEV